MPGSALVVVRAALAVLTLVLAMHGVEAADHLYDITGTGSDNLLLPTDVAAGERHVCIVDSGHHRIVCFDHRGRYRFQFGGRGTAPGKFEAPVGLAMGAQEMVYVADSGNHRIQACDFDGRCQAWETLIGDWAIRPVDIVASGDGKELFVTGNNNHQVMVLDQAGGLIRSWGTNGTAPGEFRYPATLTLTSTGRIAVVDVLNARVQVFERSGSHAFQVGRWGVSEGQLFRPKGVAVDGNGRFYVSDSYLGAVQVFAPSGEFVGLIASRDGGRFTTPVGMAVDSKNRLYVVEMRQNRVSVYQLGKP